MKALIILSTILSFNSMATTIDIIGPCSSTPAASGTIIPTNANQSLGSLTIDFLNKNKIAYIGTEGGLNSILNTPVGEESIEIISDTKMRAYGWCFSLNGQIPDRMPDEIKLNSAQDKIVWFYAYSTYDAGNWTDYCVPSYEVKAAQFCH